MQASAHIHSKHCSKTSCCPAMEGWAPSNRTHGFTVSRLCILGIKKALLCQGNLITVLRISGSVIQTGNSSCIHNQKLLYSQRTRLLHKCANSILSKVICICPMKSCRDGPLSKGNRLPNFRKIRWNSSSFLKKNGRQWWFVSFTISCRFLCSSGKTTVYLF